MSIAENLSSVRKRIKIAASKSGRAAGDIQLIAVSKTWPVEAIQGAVDAGQVAFGENKVQEILAKAPQLSEKLQWHLIGHLQKNKIRKVLPRCACIHSIDSIELARQVDRISGELNLNPSVLLQVNVADDPAKFGFSVTEFCEQFERLLELEHLRIDGLMTVPAFHPDPEQTRPHFARLRDLRDELAASFHIPLPHLSMGMSHEFEIAIEEGATDLRVGSSIFGQRIAPQINDTGL